MTSHSSVACVVKISEPAGCYQHRMPALTKPAFEERVMAESQPILAHVAPPVNESSVIYQDVPGFPGYRFGSDGTAWTCKTRASSGRVVLGNVWRQMKTRVKSCSICMSVRDGTRKLDFKISPLQRPAKICAVCGTDISNRHHCQRFCSPRCKYKNDQKYKAFHNTTPRGILSRKARGAVQRAINSGRLVRPSKCEKCGLACDPEAHHYMGYERQFWLTVQFLCVECHNNEHR